MSIDLAKNYLPYTDEIFTQESKKSLVTNNDFKFSGAAEVLIYKVTTGSMNDYGRSGTSGGNWSRYGAVESLDATLEKFLLKKDRSFTFAIDTLDEDETKQQLSGASALARQLREVVIPEVDSHIYSVMVEGAGTKPAAVALTESNIYNEIIKGNAALDNALVPETGRVLLVTPDVYLLMKKDKNITMETDIANEMRLKGVIAMIDGLKVVKVAASRFPENFGFMIAHPVATCAPIKLESFIMHRNPPGINGTLVEGRVVYDAFVLENKKLAIYYQEIE